MISVADVKCRVWDATATEFPEDLHPVVARVLAARGVSRLEQMDYRLARLSPPAGLGSMSTAVERLAAALAEQQRIVVVGDFDADGATGTALLICAMRAFGHQNIGYVVPNRFDFGYGLSPALVDYIAENESADLLVTVDNGVSSVHGAARARELGLEVIITDHHLPGEVLPDVVAMVNPNLPGDEFPSKHLAGVGVAFYVMVALRRHLMEGDWFNARLQPPNMADLLDLVALGTVADLVCLDHNNRILVSQGLRRIRESGGRHGIRALLEVAGRDWGRINATDLGFFVGPRLNAAGRLEDMSVGIECLLAETEERGRELAHQLDQLNRERRAIQTDMETRAAELAANINVSDSRMICLYDDSWHQGIVGLVASKMVQAHHRPAVVFAPEEPGSDRLKGSARSIPGLHLRDTLAAVNASHPDLMDKFGGHAMAAGLSIHRNKLAAFQTALEETATRLISAKMLEQTVWTDGELSPADLDLRLADALSQWGPWGQEFPEPVFDGWFDIVERRTVGGHHCKMRVRPRNASQILDAIAFYVDSDSVPSSNPVRLVYQLDVNEYRGQRSAQLLVRQVGG